MSIKCSTCSQIMKEEGNRLNCPVCGKSVEIPRINPLINYPSSRIGSGTNVARAAAYVMNNMDKEATDGMQREAHMRALLLELQDREARLRVNAMEFYALRNAGKVGANMDTETDQKVRDFKLTHAKEQYHDSLRKLDIEIQSLLSRREDIINILADIERGKLPYED